MNKQYLLLGGSLTIPPERPSRLNVLNGWRALAAIFLVGFAAMVFFWHQEYARAEILQEFIARAVIWKGAP